MSVQIRPVFFTALSCFILGMVRSNSKYAIASVQRLIYWFLSGRRLAKVRAFLQDFDPWSATKAENL